MKIAVGSDHAGFEDPPPWYKPAIMDHLRSRGHEVIDCGTNGPESVDYPDFAGKVCQSILSGEAECGVLMCGTGIGVGIAANRYKGIRAATCATPDMARLSRDHNNANVICLGRRILSLDKCIRLIDIWLDTPFSGGERHVRRVAKMG
ncbi:MAG: ribose 5-phosphate isomerase B [Candidatus Hydrogenedentes bacterium]|nr:ribose 5-phosphate isomerase B [Candidatus Hydrogenedentota bacterium]